MKTIFFFRNSHVLYENCVFLRFFYGFRIIHFNFHLRYCRERRMTLGTSQPPRPCYAGHKKSCIVNPRNWLCWIFNFLLWFCWVRSKIELPGVVAMLGNLEWYPGCFENDECFSFWHLRPLESDECFSFLHPRPLQINECFSFWHLLPLESDACFNF